MVTFFCQQMVCCSAQYLILLNGDLIEAFRAVGGEDDVLALVGSGPKARRLRAMSHGDPRIIFPGAQVTGPEAVDFETVDWNLSGKRFRKIAVRHQAERLRRHRQVDAGR